MTNIALFYEPMRILLGDDDTYGVYEYSDEQLAGAVRLALIIEKDLSKYTAVGLDITPDVENGDDYALISLHAAFYRIGGADEAGSIRTRALSVSNNGSRKRELLSLFRQKIYERRDEGACFTSYQNFLVFLQSVKNSGDVAKRFTEVNVSAPIMSVDIG